MAKANIKADKTRVIELTITSKFRGFLDAVWKQHPTTLQHVIDQPVLALDPGETTGVAYFDGDAKIRVHQQITKEVGQSYKWLLSLLDPDPYIHVGLAPPKHLRYEDYRVYEWKAADHAWSPVHTIQWIGAIQVAAHNAGTPASCIMAASAKAFWTDGKLDMFGLNPKGLKHGRDALRHLLYYLCFPVEGEIPK